MSTAPRNSATGARYVEYGYNGRFFRRYFAESDIEGMKAVARKALGLTPSTQLRLEQLVGGRKIDLENEDDFSVFVSEISIELRKYVTVSIVSKTPAPEFEKVEQLAPPAIPANVDEAPSKPNDVDSHAKPISKKAPASDAAVASASSVQPKSKKHARERGAADEATIATTSATTFTAHNSEPVDELADDSSLVDPSSPKKRRKIKLEMDSEGFVAVSLPPPSPSPPRHTTTTTTKKPVSAVVDSHTEPVQRRMSKSKASTSKSAPTTEAIRKPKKGKAITKKTPIEAAPSELRRCIVCLKEHPGSGLPPDCPLLADHSQDIVDFVDRRKTDLIAAQGPRSENQWAIGRMKDWLKERAKEGKVPDSSG
ncbi:hypothetical protein FRC12_017779 [Ceratobasidium sp. 428]|nr:hypothetical protein FRC12_017779 [Ceratobasidium sp. 428]